MKSFIANERPTMRNRCRGALMGLAIGDALGAAVEFRSPGSFAPVTAYRGGGPHGLNAGEWTDDTSMALALADSLATAGWDLDDQMQRYVAWWKTGEYSVNGTCFDIGITTRTQLARFQRTGQAVDPRPDEESAGHGVLLGEGGKLLITRAFLGVQVLGIPEFS